jgi:large subunit ribosomal protein L13
MKTYLPKQKNIQRNWYLIDAKDKIFGRLCSRVAILLRGKHKSDYTPFFDCGDYVVIVNIEKIKITGKKYKDKLYHHFSGYPGGIKTVTFGEAFRKNPVKVFTKAVERMLPRNKLRAKQILRLKVFKGEEHHYKNKELKTIDI